MEGPVLTTNRAVMVGESAFKTPEYASTDGVQDVGYSSESSAHLSDEAQERGTGYSPVRCLIEQAERLVRKEIKEERLSEVDSSCDASGEYTTNESDVEDSSGSDGWEQSLKIPTVRSYEGSVETVVASTALDDGCQRCRKPRKKYGRPRSMTELYHRCSPDVPLFTSEVELNALSSPTSSCNRRCIGGVCSFPKHIRLRKPCPILQRSFTAATLTQWSDTSTRRRKSSSSSSGRDCYSSSNGHPSSFQLRKYSQPSVNLQAEERSTGEENQSETDLDVTLRLEDYVLTQTTEDLSSVSDQVWDGYQDPLYLSEPYSEATADEDDLKKVTEFGDDYRDVIDVLSDTSSRPPTDIVERSPVKSPRSISSTSTPQDSHQADSDSDVEEFHHIINETRRALHFAKASLRNHTELAPPSSVTCQELIATCQTHLRCLQIVSDHLQRGEKRNQFSKRDLKQIQGLIRQWEMIQSTVDQPEQEPDEKEHEQQRQELQDKLEELRQTMADLKYTDETPHASLDELEKKVNTLQMALCALQGTREKLLEINLMVHRRMTSSLKDNVTELYQQWDDVYEHNNGHLTTLQSLSSQWNEYLRRCKKLKEKISQEEAEEEQDCTEESHKSDLRQELKDIRKLGESLQKQIGDEEACQMIADELKELEEVSLLREDSASEESLSHFEEASSKPEKKPVPSLFWRVLRAAVPIQLALVVLYCLACLLEPHCCDFINNFNFSLTPQLRYIRGPPPV